MTTSVQVLPTINLKCMTLIECKEHFNKKFFLTLSLSYDYYKSERMCESLIKIIHKSKAIFHHGVFS